MVHKLFVDFEKVYGLVRREILYNILIEICVPLKLVRLVKISLNETYSKVCIGKNLYDAFPIQNGLKQGVAFATTFQFSFKKVQESQEGVELNRTL
jgi:hypothetical protein